MTKKLISLLTLALFMTACSSNRNEPVPGTTEAAAASTAAPTMNDAEIVNMLMTVNTEEMNLAKLGSKKAQNKKVKDFANHMMKMHAKNNDEAANLRNNEKISLTETVPSNNVKLVTEDTIESMKNMNGKDFDRAFIGAQVNLHEKALNKLDTTMIPNAQNEQLKAMLEKTKGEVQHHLEMAQKLETTIQ